MARAAASAIVACLVLACSNSGVDTPPTADPKPASGASTSARNRSPGVDPRTSPDDAPGSNRASRPPASRSSTLELTFVGDVIFGRYRPSGYDPIPEDGHAVFDDMVELLRSDLLVGNLETPLVRDLPASSPIGSRFRFGASPDHARHLADAGFSAMSLANNHWFDMRKEGLEQTPRILEELGITPLGASRSEPPAFRVETLERRGWRVGFVAATTRTNAPVRAGRPAVPYLRTRDLVAQLGPLLRGGRTTHDLLVVVLHWGEEYADAPSFAQIKAAHGLVDAGADLVIGHHPHVLQAVEVYDDAIVAYSLGNFLFENTQEIPRQTGVLRARFRGEAPCLEQVMFHPAFVKRNPVQHPVPASGWMGQKIRRRMSTLSEKFRTPWREEGDDLVLSLPSCGREADRARGAPG